jgi:hypothetical protein
VDDNLQTTHKFDEKERAESEEKKKQQPNLVTNVERNIICATNSNISTARKNV